jgi:RNA polymerase II C-terminal domain phosphatase-like 3/4
MFRSVIDDMLNYGIYVVAGSSKNAQVDVCPHPGYFGGLCFRCGKPQAEEAVSGVAFGYIHKVHLK